MYCSKELFSFSSILQLAYKLIAGCDAKRYTSKLGSSRLNADILEQGLQKWSNEEGLDDSNFLAIIEENQWQAKS